MRVSELFFYGKNHTLSLILFYSNCIWKALQLFSNYNTFSQQFCICVSIYTHFNPLYDKSGL